MNSPIEAAQAARRTCRRGDCRGRQIIVAPLRQGRANRAGFTLIEMLVSLAITLIMMGAVVTLFGTISASVSDSRSIIEISERLRAARNRLQTDLQGATATMKPPLRPENDEGYFEYIEGPLRDRGWLPNTHTAVDILATAQGDTDDILMFTVRSRGEPFVGKFGNTTSESQIAEVMYFCAPARTPTGFAGTTLYIDPTSGNPVRTMTLYRRVLLVNPGVAQSPTFSALAPADYPNYFDNFDISARMQKDSAGTWTLVPNSLGDLTKRENRFAHYGTFPFSLNKQAPVDFGGGIGQPGPDFPRQSSAYLVPFFAGNSASGLPASPRFGDDVLLTNVLSFDVQVYDPSAPVQVSSSTALTPSDPAYTTGGSVLGAYADLGWAPGPAGPQFNSTARQTYAPDLGGAPLLSPYLPSNPTNIDTSNDPPIPSGTSLTYTYDTWSMHYENNGIDDDGGTPLIDEGTDGLDNDTNPADPGYGIVDDADELETRPPFAAQLRGIRVTIRVYEPSSQQIRQVTVVGDFLPD